MKFSTLNDYLAKLDATSKRLEITDILTDLINKLTPEEIDKALYLILGSLKAPFENVKFNIADKMMIRIINATYDTTKSEAMFKKIGDLGDVGYELADDIKAKPLEITEAHARLMEIARIQGTGSQDLKIKKTSIFLKEVNKISAKYTIRMILGTTRLGFTELTVIDALSQSTGNKNNAQYIESVYNTHPDIGEIAKILKTDGLKGLKKIGIQTGVPVLSQKAQRVSGPEEALEKMGNVWAEFKFDGTRVQLHLDRNKPSKNNNTDQNGLFNDNNKNFLVCTYTRNQNETTDQFPDLVEAAIKQIDANSVILDGEGIGLDKATGEFKPFQETMQRKRKYDITSMAADIPLKYMVFDILFLNGESLVDKPLRERRKIIDSIIKKGETIVIDEYLETKELDKLMDYFELAKEKHLEGLVLKKPENPYQAGARSFSWIKLKKDSDQLLKDSVDCVVLGYYAGKGARSDFGIGKFLVGVRDEKTDSFKTITKIGTGLKEDDFRKLKSLCDRIKVNAIPSNVVMDKIYTPDVIVSPKIVVEVVAEELTVSSTHTAGYALRFPRLLRFRDDKSSIDATTLKEIEIMYKSQKPAKYD